MNTVKPGYQTTEFWLSLGISLWAAANQALPATWSAIIAGVLGGVYTIARTLHKNRILGGSVGSAIDQIDPLLNPPGPVPPGGAV